MIRVNGMQDVNRLRDLLAAGAITEDDLASMTIGGNMGGAPAQGPAPQNALARMLSPQEEFAQGDTSGQLPMGSMRNEETGRVTYFKPGGGGFSGQPYAAQPAQAQRPRMRVVGFGNGQATDLGEEDARALPVDYTRPGIDIPGIGKGRYTADGRYAIVANPDGSQTKVILGYDAAASERGQFRNLKMRGEELANELREEQIGALRDRRQMVAAGPAATATDAGQAIPQAALEKIHGKPDKGMRWTQYGRLEPLPGGEVEKGNQTALEKAQDAISQIDALIGGKGKDAHPGFGQAVGLGVPGLKYIPGTDTADFNKRLDQLKGGAFLEAFQTLKGGGQITEVEGKKATAAITRMDTAQSEDEFVKAATEFRGILSRGLEKAKAAGAKAPATEAQPSQGPKVGEIRRGYVYTGGDPGSQSSWRKVGP